MTMSTASRSASGTPQKQQFTLDGGGMVWSVQNTATARAARRRSTIVDAVKPLTAIFVLLLAGCGGNSGGPSPQPLSVTCPATVNAQADKSGTVVVHYPAPVPSGGQAPFG